MKDPKEQIISFMGPESIVYPEDNCLCLHNLLRRKRRGLLLIKTEEEHWAQGKAT